MSDRSEYTEEDFERLEASESSGLRSVDALGVTVVVIFLAAVGLVTYLLTSAVAMAA